MGQKSRPVGGPDRQGECAKAELEQTRQLLASSVARLYWDWQTQAAVEEVLTQIKSQQDNIIGADRELYQHGITSSVEGVETDISASKTEEQIAEVHGKMKAIEARLNALTNTPRWRSHGMPYRRLKRRYRRRWDMNCWPDGRICRRRTGISKRQ